MKIKEFITNLPKAERDLVLMSLSLKIYKENSPTTFEELYCEIKEELEKTVDVDKL